ncbi:MAG: hypothetical protein GY940_02475, partial [bacterium]|nr:hypothetical protein [bacterium]
MKKKLKKVCWMLSLLILFGSVVLKAAIPVEERAALVALYNSTNGDSWYYNGGWKTPPLEADGFGAIGSEGTWPGIT